MCACVCVCMHECVHVQLCEALKKIKKINVIK